ncbi:hypothetical protein SteCoe_354 [Stentor coeruleus]|uniref:Uncharacterized protein n=1 Tax=Stentor coeruleus TaxID=5963 RepID=A0A1R2D4M8_9CILI|nr:hypothetical protein SteCoe_354 [Stentor coeruleus]
MNYTVYNYPKQSEDVSGHGTCKDIPSNSLFQKSESLEKKQEDLYNYHNPYFEIYEFPLSQIDESKLKLDKHYINLHDELEQEKNHLIKSLDNYREKLYSGYYYKDFKVKDVSDYIKALLFNLNKFLEITSSSNTLMINKDDIYRGNTQLYLKNGMGTVLHNDLEIMQFGNFKNGHMDGYGFCFDHRLNKYEGDWENGKRSGQGIFEYCTGEIYKGGFIDDKCSGRGEMDYKNGNIFNGIFEDNLYKVGTLYLANGDKYVGPFKDQKYTGKGEYFSADGTYYKGLFLNGKYHGKGKIQYPSGESYRGNWGEGVRNHRGICVYPNNDIYEGNWQNNERHGKGKMTYSDGTVKEGIWHKGEIHGKGFFTFKDGLRIAENFN